MAAKRPHDFFDTLIETTTKTVMSYTTDTPEGNKNMRTRKLNELSDSEEEDGHGPF